MTAGRTLAVLLQGPVHDDTNGYSTAGLLDRLNASRFRDRFLLVSVLWSDERPEAVAAVRSRVDEVVLAEKPAAHGNGNRNFQSTGVAAGLAHLEGRGVTHVLKSRHDFGLSERLLGEVVARADAGFAKVFVTNLFTRRETFHISDMLLFSTLENVRAWFDPRTVYYQDLYSAEVQFARCFVRNRRLPYRFTQVDYLRFLRDWVEMIEWTESGVTWFKHPLASRARANAEQPIIRDRDSGAYMAKLLPGDYPRRLQRYRREVTLQTLAVAHRVWDALFSYGLVVMDRVLSVPFPEGARYRRITLAGPLALEVKLGFRVRRYYYYLVDPYGGEEEKPIGAELTHDRRYAAPVPAVPVQPGTEPPRAEPPGSAPPAAPEPEPIAPMRGPLAFRLRWHRAARDLRAEAPHVRGSRS